MGPGVANECVETKDGLHIWEDHFYPEVIDPETGAVLPEGERGELVFTSLTKEGMPVVRYRTRDLTRLLPGTARTMRRMEKVTGRSDDMVIVRGVNMFPTQIEEQLLKSEVLTGHYQIVLTREGRMDEVAVHVEARPEYFDPVLLEAEAKVVVARIKDTIGLTTRVVVEPPGTVERSVGKARRVVDQRPKDGRQHPATHASRDAFERASVPDVLRPEPHADDACRQPPQHGIPSEHPHRQRRLRRCRALRSTLLMTRFWIATCTRCVMRVGHSRRRCTARRSSSVAPPSRSRGTRMLAVATASWIARLIPTPPTGDIACAASPMHSRPGRNQVSSRFTATVSSFTSSQDASSCTRSRRYGASRAISARNASRPRACTSSMPPLGMTNAHCQ